jgi:solute carrier family 25 uncoupling protein 27
VVDCLLQTSRKEGVLALYKGFLLTWSRLGPWQLTFWVSYEQMRGAFGMKSF